MTSKTTEALFKAPNLSSNNFLASLTTELRNNSEKTTISEVRVPAFLSQHFKSLLDSLYFDVSSNRLSDMYLCGGIIISIMAEEFDKKLDNSLNKVQKAIRETIQNTGSEHDEYDFLVDLYESNSDFFPEPNKKTDIYPLDKLVETLSEWISETNMEEQFEDIGGDTHILASMIFSLNYLALKFEDELRAKERSEESYFEHIAMLYAQMKSIETIIKELRSKKPIIKELKEKKINVRQRMREAAKASHAQTDKIKNDFETWFFENRQRIKYIKTKIGIAEKFFYEILDSDDQEKITPRTLEKHLTKILYSAPR